jgi:Xaa-Pro aminopeptidase
MSRQEVDLAAIAPTANMRYLLGFSPLMDERPCVLLVSRQDTRLVVPELNADQVEAHTGMTAIRWPDAEGSHGALDEALAGLGPSSGAVLAADNTMRADVLLLLQDMINPQKSLAAGDLMAMLRIRKSEAEIDALARAAALADEALMAGADICQPGVTEREVADSIASYFRQHGVESVDFAIVASGPNGAYPHHETGNRRLEVGDTIIIDIGATLDGYKSDVSRVVQLDQPSDEVRQAYDAVLEANRHGREAAVAGARAKEVDFAARDHLEKADYGRYFVHRTGHGLGLEGHEPPWITAESNTVLEPGMVFSVEPGVYLPGKFGIRIEDIIVVTEGESRNLTGLDHSLIVKD